MSSSLTGRTSCRGVLPEEIGDQRRELPQRPAAVRDRVLLGVGVGESPTSDGVLRYTRLGAALRAITIDPMNRVLCNEPLTLKPLS